MSEWDYHREPAVPYETQFFSDWCNEQGIDEDNYSSMMKYGSFKFAKLRSREISAQLVLRQQIESSLPLAGSELVDDPRLTPEARGTVPKIYHAPEGKAFEISVRTDYDGGWVSEDGWEGPPLSSDFETFVGEYLAIDTAIVRGVATATIVVREKITNYALPIMLDGNPQTTEVIRLPSRANPDEDGASVMFARHDGWRIVRLPSGKLRGDYDKSTVRLVPYEPEIITEPYVADFAQYNDFPLDEFLYVEEEPVLPPGYAMVPYMRKGELKYRPEYEPTSILVLPPINRDDWTDLYNHHGIMIKRNPHVNNRRLGDSRFTYLDFDRRSLVEFEIRKFNTQEHKGRTFMRALAVHRVGEVSLKDVLKIALSKDQLEGEDREKFG